MNASVIIPTYNGEGTITKCLRALQKQTEKNFEIIVVDDGSTDKTAHRVKSLAQKDKRIRLVQQKNGGPARARNTGAHKAQTGVVVFIDDDCIAEQHWLEEMLMPFSDKKIVGVQGAYKTRQKEIVARFGQVEIEHRYERMKKRAFIDFIGSYSAAYKKSIFLQEGGFDETFRIPSGEDPELSYRLAEKGFKMVFNPNAIVYHYHPKTLAHYLKVKFYRAYWRVRMYKKHANKMVSDSYTPQEVKIQMFLFYAGVLLLLPGVFFPSAIPAGLVALFGVVALSVPFSLFAVTRDPLAGVVAPLIVFLRTGAFCTGMVAGALSQQVWK